MKPMILLLAIALLSCSKHEDPKPKVVIPQTDPGLQDAFDLFKFYCQGHAITVDPNIVLEYGNCDCSKVIDGKIVAYVNAKVSDPDLKREFFVFHSLGHAVLKKSESIEPVKIMNQTQVDYFVMGGLSLQMINDLFAN